MSDAKRCEHWSTEYETRGAIPAPPGHRVLFFSVSAEGAVSWWTEPVVAYGQRWSRTSRIGGEGHVLKRNTWELEAWVSLTVDPETGTLDDNEMVERQIACYLAPGEDVEAAKTWAQVRFKVRAEFNHQKLPVPPEFEKETP